MRTPALTVAALLFLSATALTQRGGYSNSYSGNPRYDGRFMFARLAYTVGPGGFYYHGMPAWAHGMPHAEENLMKIMEAISLLDPHVNEGPVLALDDPDLFKFPVSYMTEAGFWVLNDKEAAAFRAYLLKGGFVIFDDFRDPPRGGGGWPNFEYNMGRVLPGVKFFDRDVSDPIFHSFYEIDSFDIVPQYYDFNRPVFKGIYEDNDPHKRLMAIINFNTDVSNFWEFSGQGYFAVDLSNQAFKLGVNYVMYGLMH
jgi:hypothetical protein